MILIGGTTGGGKSTLCHNILAQICLSYHGSKRILLISNEETLAETYSKLACLVFEKAWKRDYRDSKSPEDLEMIDELAKQLMSRVTVAENFRIDVALESAC